MPEEKITRRERRRRWKAVKKERRAALREQYRYAPWAVRFWNLYARKPIKTLFTLLLIVTVLVALIPSAVLPLVQKGLMLWYNETRNAPVSKETIYALSPLDEEGGRRIDALGSVGEDDTWTFCVYLVGSNLEGGDVSELSYLTMLETQARAEAYKTARRDTFLSQLEAFTDELMESGLEMPAYFYYPEKHVSDAAGEPAPAHGAAATDIGEITSAAWPSRIRIVMQTGGAACWTNSMVNPNRTQRFLYADGVFSEIENLPLQPSCEPETLADFLFYCRDNYAADHQVLILWDHGGGAFGFGHDSIYGNGMTLADLREALSMVYTPDLSEPAFDIIGFDACLMASLEVTHALEGFAAYYAVSEETEPGDGWNYGVWLKAMADDPGMHPAAVCRAIADSYMDYYMTQNANVGILMKTDVTFSVLDARKCAALYDAYCDLARAQLVRAAGEIGVLSEIGRCANHATHLIPSYYTVYNTVDLGGYVDCTIDSFPEQSARVKQLLGEAVLYHRQSGNLNDTQGISVYIPGTINSVAGLQYFLDYLATVPVDDSIRALYYYKVAGCLNDELAEYLATLTDVEARPLNTGLFRAYTQLTPAIEADAFSLPVGEELAALIQNYELEVGVYDRDKLTITYYGRNDAASLDGEGSLLGCFDGQWICLDGAPLTLEVASSSASSVEYRAHVLYNGDDAYLVIGYDRDSETYQIQGVREIPDPQEDGINYLTLTRTQTAAAEGARIVPLYTVMHLDNGKEETVRGKAVVLGSSTRVERRALPDGYYLCTAVITDPRSEQYYSAVVAHNVAGGRVTARAVDPDFYGRSY